MDPKRGTDHRRLDMRPEGFVAWRDSALGYLEAERLDVLTLLLWPETQNPTIGAAEEQRGATIAGVHGDRCHISHVIFESLKMIVSDLLLNRARACEDGRGPQLWRKLHVEWRGSVP